MNDLHLYLEMHKTIGLWARIHINFAMHFTHLKIFQKNIARKRDDGHWQTSIWSLFLKRCPIYCGKTHWAGKRTSF